MPGKVNDRYNVPAKQSGGAKALPRQPETRGKELRSLTVVGDIEVGLGRHSGG